MGEKFSLGLTFCARKKASKSHKNLSHIVVFIATEILVIERSLVIYVEYPTSHLNCLGIHSRSKALKCPAAMQIYWNKRKWLQKT